MNSHRIWLSSLVKEMFIKIFVLQIFYQTCFCTDFIYYVKEGRSPDSYLGDIATDTHLMDSILSKDYSSIRFNQLQKNVLSDNQLFKVTNTGKIFTAQTLDAESLCKYNTECFRMVDVAVQKDQSFFKILEIKVVIEDANDHQPEFPSKHISLQFSDGDKKDTMRSIPNAVDRDVSVKNSQISYQLKENSDELFTLSFSKRFDGSYNLGINLEKEIDREVKDTYTLQVIATDGGSPPKQGVLSIKISVTDVNDNPPVYSQNSYNVTVNNQYQKNKLVIALHATDLDADKNGRVTYHFSSKTADTAQLQFRLDEITGEIFLQEDFPYEKRQTYELYVEATDGGNPPLTSVAMVQVNVVNQQNNAPVIEMNFVSKSSDNMATISEGMKVGSFIAYVKVSDNDVGKNGEVVCNLHHGKFKLQSLGKNKYKVILKNLVDREKESHIEFIIICQDKGSPSMKTEQKFSIQVMDVNDVQPQFTKETFKFLTYENEDPSFPVGFINATDPDLGSGGKLTYSLLRIREQSFPFQISDIGFILTTQSMDRERQEIYKFQVFVRDNGNPSLNNTANVIVEVMDENDNAPYFIFPSVNPFSLDVHYHPQSKNDITVLKASDRDRRQNAFLKYEILGGNDKHLFAINQFSGVLSFTRTVYQNDAGSYDLKLAVKDSGTPVLSATTTLFLTLTVSNKTSTMFATVNTQSDDKIHINLFIIIVVAAVTISVVFVVAITICIVKSSHQRNSDYSNEVDNADKFLDENRQTEYFCEPMCSQYDVPAAISEEAKSKALQPIQLKAEPHSRFDSSHNKKSLFTGVYCTATTELASQPCLQKEMEMSDSWKDKEITSCEPSHFNKKSTLSPIDIKRHGQKEGFYETLPVAQKFFHSKTKLPEIFEHSEIQTSHHASFF
ncbi:protocadherin beta-15-like [Octopus vulgaris]|nr:protocadherin beta-15-like [Octopus vulgaris]